MLARFWYNSIISSALILKIYHNSYWIRILWENRYLTWYLPYSNPHKKYTFSKIFKHSSFSFVFLLRYCYNEGIVTSLSQSDCLDYVSCVMLLIAVGESSCERRNYRNCGEDPSNETWPVRKCVDGIRPSEVDKLEKRSAGELSFLKQRNFVWNVLKNITFAILVSLMRDLDEIYPSR